MKLDDVGLKIFQNGFQSFLKKREACIGRLETIQNIAGAIVLGMGFARMNESNSFTNGTKSRSDVEHVLIHAASSWCR